MALKGLPQHFQLHKNLFVVDVSLNAVFRWYEVDGKDVIVFNENTMVNAIKPGGEFRQPPR